MIDNIVQQQRLAKLARRGELSAPPVSDLSAVKPDVIAAPGTPVEFTIPGGLRIGDHAVAECLEAFPDEVAKLVKFFDSWRDVFFLLQEHCQTLHYIKDGTEGSVAIDKSKLAAKLYDIYFAHRFVKDASVQMCFTAKLESVICVALDLEAMNIGSHWMLALDSGQERVVVLLDRHRQAPSHLTKALAGCQKTGYRLHEIERICNLSHRQDCFDIGVIHKLCFNTDSVLDFDQVNATYGTFGFNSWPSIISQDTEQHEKIRMLTLVALLRLFAVKQIAWFQRYYLDGFGEQGKAIMALFTERWRTFYAE